MNRIIDWLRKVRLGNRHRRVELLGGHPGEELAIAIERFDPNLNEDARTRGVRAKVAQLGATSFDEATGNALAPFITAEGNGWQHRLLQQHEAYKASAGQRLDKAYAVVWQQRQLLDQDLTKLRHSETALETAVLALSGHEPDEVAAQTQVISVITEHPAEPADPGLTPAAASDSNGKHTAEGQFTARPEDATDVDGLDKLDIATMLQRPRISRSELRQLLDPQDANRVPRWGEPGFRDGTLLAGRPRSTFVHVLALVLAACADIGAFTQTVQLVLPESDLVVFLVVFGLTAVVLYLAHMVGVMLRDARAASHSARPRGANWSRGRRITALGCALIWLAVGGLAFWVRYTVPLQVAPTVGGCSGAIGEGAGSGCAGSGATPSHPLQAAAIFFGLYLATGLVAAVGAYVTHNPYRGGYTSAIRAYRKASERTSASVHQFGLARAAYLRQEAEIAASEQTLAEAQGRNKEFVTELKQIALIEIASMLKDPAVTDAFFADPAQPPSHV